MKATFNKEIAPTHVRSGTALRSRGSNQVKNILDVTRKLFITKGYSGFSLRNVARLAGISPGNLSYYFKSKNDLFHSMLDSVNQSYRVAVQKRIAKAPIDPQARFLSIIDYQISDARHADSRQFFYQLWAISVHDPFVEECREATYTEIYEVIRELCADVNPDLSKNALSQRVYLLMAQFEGLHVIFGNQKASPSSLKPFKELFRQQALALVLAD